MADVALSVGEAEVFALAALQRIGFLFFVIDPELLMPAAHFKRHLAELVESVRATPRQDGIDAIRIPSERAFDERARRRRDGITIPLVLYERMRAL